MARIDCHNIWLINIKPNKKMYVFIWARTDNGDIKTVRRFTRENVTIPRNDIINVIEVKDEDNSL